MGVEGGKGGEAVEYDTDWICRCVCMVCVGGEGGGEAVECDAIEYAGVWGQGEDNKDLQVYLLQGLLQH